MNAFMTSPTVRIVRATRWLQLAVLALPLLACSSLAPEPVRESFPHQPTVEQARNSIDNFVGRRVRWGGTVVRVENRAQESIIEVVNRELDASARPIRQDRSGGRFLAVIRGFIDPVIYEPGRDITVIGTLEKIVNAPLGGFAYQYPQLQVESHKLWEKWPRPYRRDPFGYDPWYPWHPGYAPWWY